MFGWTDLRKFNIRKDEFDCEGCLVDLIWEDASLDIYRIGSSEEIWYDEIENYKIVLVNEVEITKYL